MILKRFKENSNQKYINRILNSRISSVDNRHIESVGIVVNIEEFSDYDELKALFKSLGINENKIKIISFISNEKMEINSWDSSFYPKDIGWQGKILDQELQTFIDSEFDALISYYKNDNLNLNMITTLSKANFKIGISNTDERLNDFIIDVETGQLQLFKEELLKYLKVLNKI